ncbi:sensor histidine kinase [Kitasatospora phosalacinea]|uniref:histidine kinase n=1 Tax=Kitasatospora phosalacinea TaxID=2065 RepID=A0A9W6PJP5_9ACTN|nr:sensor histidine kinase [Kitasatospora phosalacinea]GLW56138.1 two-component sensor histidine kinase [Kitasatospora phosalacinea]
MEQPAVRAAAAPRAARRADDSRTARRAEAPRTARIVDGLLAVGTVAAVLTVTVRLDGRLDAAGTLPLAVWLGALLLARRRWPLTVLLLGVQAVVVFRTAGLTDVGWVWPVSAAYATLAADDRPGRPGLPWAAGVGLAELAFAGAWETGPGGAAPREVLGSLGAEALWLAVLLAAATAYRNRLRWRAELDERLLHAARERDLEAGRRIAEARLDIARELHDVVGHTLTVVGLQLRVAAEALDDSPEEARSALATAQQVRTEALRDLRSLVHVLRAPDSAPDRAPGGAPQDPAAGVPEIAALVDRMRSAELDVRLETAGDLAAVPAPVSLAVHRIVQEALTNTVRHARASRAGVDVRCGGGRVEVRVTDDGRAPAQPPGAAGHGVRGMDERVRALGGDFSAGPHGEGDGWLVRAVIPVPGFHP